MRAAVLTVLVATITLAAGPARAQGELTTALRALTEDPQLAGARIGVHVRDLAQGKVLLRHGDDLGCMTASNMKLISVAVALITLGADFTFVTRLQAHGSMHGSVLDGDLV